MGEAPGRRAVAEIDRPTESFEDTARTRRHGPGGRVNAELKNWRVLRKIRSSPNTADTLIAAVQTLMIVNA
jgi:hypothetical protein